MSEFDERQPAVGTSLMKAVANAMASLPPCCSRLWLALSGGCDSVALLHAVQHAQRQLQARHPERHWPVLQAVHVNHQLQASAAEFEALCRTLCTAWQIPLYVQSVEVSTGSSLEQQARAARYGVFEACLAADDVLWMAHHADDQAETLLQRFLRGSGVRGLTGIPAQRDLGAGQLMRPWLACSHAQIAAYAQQHQLPWCEDPSNHDVQHERNYLRQRVIPVLKARWPQAIDAVCQTTDHLREADRLLMRMADRQLAHWPEAPQRLPIPALLSLEDDECRLVIRRALSLLRLPLPPRARLMTLIAQLTAEQGMIDWPGASARWWQHCLYLLPPPQANASLTPALLTQWVLVSSQGEKVYPRLEPRRGGERLYVRGHHRTLKALFQHHRVPPWQREDYRVAWYHECPLALLSEHHAIMADGWQALPPARSVATDK